MTDDHGDGAALSGAHVHGDRPDVRDAAPAGAADGHLDGNALAGPLREIFAVDVTAAVGRCAGCGRTGPVASLRVYGPAPGLVARCPGCGEIVLRLVRGPGDMWLDLRGAVSLRISLGEAAG